MVLPGPAGHTLKQQGKNKWAMLEAGWERGWGGWVGGWWGHLAQGFCCAPSNVCEGCSRSSSGTRGQWCRVRHR